jgi:hypothetical protein
MTLNQMKPLCVKTSINFNILNEGLTNNFKVLFKIIRDVNSEIKKGVEIDFNIEDNNRFYIVRYNKNTVRGRLFREKLNNYIETIKNDEDKQNLTMFLTVIYTF